ncbi:hypothetical protein HDV00_011173 [Rhizophlyctis rosea]|nr:hypothetical protein HDV00_011173 [Rhizophlyctis rosea]
MSTKQVAMLQARIDKQQEKIADLEKQVQAASSASSATSASSSDSPDQQLDTLFVNYPNETSAYLKAIVSSLSSGNDVRGAKKGTPNVAELFLKDLVLVESKVNGEKAVLEAEVARLKGQVTSLQSK